jgi:hypothetical protein
MSRDELENLVAVGSLKRGSSSPREIAGLIASGRARLHDAASTALSPDSRFDLAYNAAHALALAALRHAGYRSENRYAVFQALPYTLALGPRVWRVLSRAHDIRNMLEYEGTVEVDERFLDDLLAAAALVEQAVRPIESTI